MKIKILVVAITLIIVSSTFVASANIKNNAEIKGKTNDIDDIIDIRIARLSAEVIGKTESLFETILNGYQWTVGNNTYKFKIFTLNDKDIFKGDLTTENYDLLTMIAYDSDKEILKHFYPSIRNKIWKTKITDFVKAGGGYIGYCSPTLLTTKLEGNPKTLLTKIVDFIDLEISDVKLIFENGLPFLAQLSGKPEMIGPLAYEYFHCKSLDRLPPGGSLCNIVPLDFVINSNNPIFDDFLEEKRRISWCAGPAFELPDEPDHNITVLAYYPKEEISDNKSTQIHAWKYIGGIRSFLKGLLKSFGRNRNTFGFLPSTLLYVRDWERTDKIIQTHFANKAFMTIETYPNKNQARIVLCGGHPEMGVFWGGHIEEVDDTLVNNLHNGFYYWMDITPFDETHEDERTYNWWIVRRHFAWASKKVPDNDLPPVYASSQVSDIYPYNQSSEFTITGNAEVSDGIVSLDLYYRYSDNNETWNPWMLYDTDSDVSDGWSWEFNAPNETGYYEFYSIRHVQYAEYTEAETVPPGPDAIARVVD